ncbi:heavy metal translocating P-type ATPase [Peptoniphilus equinus]|uniref:P-type Cu(+) transporter n=1 Tax=Peptoniphilus equinus TaxID=3016343 RepID=A0ABY7QV81_9FIRM|nr:heavy metal translocating P-type ATPase [Peptoniphilus equinus]WBW50175.1 heavy metal translocating P-type ATPase [Peptoniphilus equinus]
MKQQFNVTGMTCAACSARVERKVSNMDGVNTVGVNLLTGSMVVDYDGPTAADIIATVEKAGYGASIKADKMDETPAPRVDEVATIRRRLMIAGTLTLPIFYIAMGDMWGFIMPHFLTGLENAGIYALTQFMLLLPVLYVTRDYFSRGFKNLVQRAPNMDSLIAVGGGAAVLYGIYALFRINYALGHADMDVAHYFMMHLYFESAAMIVTLITFGKYLEARAKGRTTEAITKLMDLTPKTVKVLRQGVEVEVLTQDLVVGDHVVLRAGSAIPVDGVVVSGHGSVDESAITGESMPVEKTVGDRVTSGGLNKTGYLVMEAERVGSDTTLAQMIQLVEEATSSKAPIAKLADKISGIFVPTVMTIAAAAFVVWWLGTGDFEFALSIGISVLVISCPCALGLATPTAIMVGTGKGAEHGVLIKSAESLEVLHGITTVVLDKTGTITEGKPVVTDVVSVLCDKERLIAVAAAVEKLSSHPLAEAMISHAEAQGLTLPEATDYTLLEGRGITGVVDGTTIYAGNGQLMADQGFAVTDFETEVARFTEEGKTPMYFASDRGVLGVIAVADVIKADSKAAVATMRHMGIDVVMITGDNARTADAIASQVGITHVIADVHPQDKARYVRELGETGKVAMVGDGINDAPALVQADVGIAIGAGTEVAIESADVVLMTSRLSDVPLAIKLSKAVMRTIKENLFWAFIYNVIGIPIAAGALYHSFGLLLNPMVAATAMSFSSVSVVTNALRLKFFTPRLNDGIVTKEEL